MTENLVSVSVYPKSCNYGFLEVSLKEEYNSVFFILEFNFSLLTVKGKKEFLNASVLHCRT